MIQCPPCYAWHWKQEMHGNKTPCCHSGDRVIPNQHFPPQPIALLTPQVALHATFISNARFLNQRLCFSAMGTTPVASAGGLGFHSFNGPHCIRCNGQVLLLFSYVTDALPYFTGTATLTTTTTPPPTTTTFSVALQLLVPLLALLSTYLFPRSTA